MRHCCECGKEITACNGFVNADDFLKYMDGEITVYEVREVCGLCILNPEHSPDLHELER